MRSVLQKRKQMLPFFCKIIFLFNNKNLKSGIKEMLSYLNKRHLGFLSMPFHWDVIEMLLIWRRLSFHFVCVSLVLDLMQVNIGVDENFKSYVGLLKYNRPNGL